MKQLVSGSTHKNGHTLGLLLTRSDEVVATQVSIQHDWPSDHSAVTCKLSISKPPEKKSTVTYRHLKKINVENFRQDIMDSALADRHLVDTAQLAARYNNILGTLLDKHAPITSRKMTLRPHAPWFSAQQDALRKSKLEKRRLERQWKTSHLEVHWQLYSINVRYTNSCLIVLKESITRPNWNAVIRKTCFVYSRQANKSI